MSEDVRGRKVAPIYNALDSGNYKGAIKLCQKKDIEKWDITQALLSYALVCMHRNEEALEVARAVKVSGIILLSTISYTKNRIRSLLMRILSAL